MVNLLFQGNELTSRLRLEKGRPKVEDKFKEINSYVEEGIYYIIKKLQESEQIVKKNASSTYTVRMNGEIKDKIASVQKQIGYMNDELRKQQKDKKVDTSLF